MKIKLVGGRYDGTEGEPSDPRYDGFPRIWVKPDPYKRGETGLMFAAKPPGECYCLVEMLEEADIYLHTSLPQDMYRTIKEEAWQR